ncbi:MAG TPA: hypothetical protein PLZ86_09375, partial [bacterium]|nr:hypothetical protein [bacterium]
MATIFFMATNLYDVRRQVNGSGGFVLEVILPILYCAQAMDEQNTLILKAAFSIASKTGANAVLLHADPLDDTCFPGPVPRKQNLILLTKKKKIESGEGAKDDLLKRARGVITLPRIALTRIAIIKIGTTLALSQELLEPGAKVVFAVGGPEGGPLDLIQSVDTSKESEIITGRGIM